MALGFGFNKTKVMQAAERFVLQGKIPNAIAEYEKVIAHDSRDLTVLNTLGDLYSRSGRTDDALQCFRKVADAYAADGFALKAIAMYKKITKLNPHALECILKLGELYSLQGLFSDARAQYVAAAEHHLSRKDSEAAAAVYRKALELDPENAHMQQRLAELYLSSGKREEAAEIYIMAAQSLHCRGRHPAALDLLDKLLKVAPQHAAALMLCGKVATECGDYARAVRNLEVIPDLDQRPDALRQLVRTRLAASEFDAAEQVARRLAQNHADAGGIFSLAEALLQQSQPERALRCLQPLEDTIVNANAAEIAALLQSAVKEARTSVPVLELALQLNRRIAERGSVAELIELLAQAYVQAGELARAQKLYAELVELEPDNEMHQRNLAQLAAGSQAVPGSSAPETPAAASDAVSAADVPVPAELSGYPPEIAQALESAFTDAELFQSYNSPARAIAALEAVLSDAPADVGLNQRLATLYIRAERYADAAERFGVLRRVTDAQGLTDDSQQYAALEQKYRERAGSAPAATASKNAAPAASLSPAFVPEFDLAAPAEAVFDAQPNALPATHVSELAPPAEPKPETAPSSEWDQLASEESEPVSDPSDANGVAEQGAQDPFAACLEEARFYLLHGLQADAEAALRNAEQLRPGALEVAQLRAEFLLADAALDANIPEVQVGSDCGAGDEFDAMTDEEPLPVPVHVTASTPEIESQSPEPIAPAHPETTTIAASSPEPQLSAEEEFNLAWELDAALPDDFSLGNVAPAVPTTAPNGGKTGPESNGHSAHAQPAERARVAPLSVQPKQAAKPALPAKQEPNGDDLFGDIFEEFRSSLEQPDGDLEQHYNLGLAMKDMGLLDEAVGELQRVCNALERGATFPDAVQAYTWLAHCLVERGAPQAAVRWYKRALSIPTLDPDAQVAIHYELGLAYEKAGSRGTALEHFMEAYGSNIDYRDVAERIEALRG